MKLKLKISLTNWVSIVGIFLATYLASAISELIEIKSFNDLSNSLITGFLGGLFAIIFYGAIFWIGFFALMLLLDFVLMNENKKWLRLKLLIEWTIISSPFAYWFIQYKQWIFLVAIVAFFAGQTFREKLILKIIQ